MKKIGVFDSGYGGLTILKDIQRILPEYDYVYLGDNARAPYGTRSFDVVYQFTLQAVKKLFELDCDLVILACNTASAKALRTIQQNDLPKIAPSKRVLGVIRPTAEQIGKFTSSNVVGILATPGTVSSESYLIEIHKQYPDLKVLQKACPLWVPLIENNKYFTEAGQMLIKEDYLELLEMDSKMDAVLLACTHYPIIQNQLEQISGDKIQIVTQGEIVARSLKDYLKRHPKIEGNLIKSGTTSFYTTEQPTEFNVNAAQFIGNPVNAIHTQIDTIQ
jgi:glutamate racemase